LAKLTGTSRVAGPDASARTGRTAAIDNSQAVIAVLGTLDTKAAEVSFLVSRLEASGHRCWVVDLGTAGQPGRAADTSRDQVLQAAPAPQPGEPGPGDGKAALMELMSAGASQILSQLIAAGQVAGVIGIGGGQGSWMAASVMRDLPLGLPKVLVSTVGLRASEYIGQSDLVRAKRGRSGWAEPVRARDPGPGRRRAGRPGPGRE
jgi:uncharacterized protein (UPF0261 family)